MKNFRLNLDNISLNIKNILYTYPSDNSPNYIYKKDTIGNSIAVWEINNKKDQYIENISLNMLYYGPSICKKIIVGQIPHHYNYTRSNKYSSCLLKVKIPYSVDTKPMSHVYLLGEPDSSLIPKDFLVDDNMVSFHLPFGERDFRQVINYIPHNIIADKAVRYLSEYKLKHIYDWTTHYYSSRASASKIIKRIHKISREIYNLLGYKTKSICVSDLNNNDKAMVLKSMITSLSCVTTNSCIPYDIITKYFLLFCKYYDIRRSIVRGLGCICISFKNIDNVYKYFDINKNVFNLGLSDRNFDLKFRRSSNELINTDQYSKMYRSTYSYIYPMFLIWLLDKFPNTLLDIVNNNLSTETNIDSAELIRKRLYTYIKCSASGSSGDYYDTRDSSSASQDSNLINGTRNRDGNSLTTYEVRILKSIKDTLLFGSMEVPGIFSDVLVFPEIAYNIVIKVVKYYTSLADRWLRKQKVCKERETGNNYLELCIWLFVAKMCNEIISMLNLHYSKFVSLADEDIKGGGTTLGNLYNELEGIKAYAIRNIQIYRLKCFKNKVYFSHSMDTLSFNLAFCNPFKQADHTFEHDIDVSRSIIRDSDGPYLQNIYLLYNNYPLLSRLSGVGVNYSTSERSNYFVNNPVFGIRFTGIPDIYENTLKEHLKVESLFYRSIPLLKK